MKFPIITQLYPKLMQAYYISGFAVTIFAQLLPKMMIASISKSVVRIFFQTWYNEIHWSEVSQKSSFQLKRHFLLNSGPKLMQACISRSAPRIAFKIYSLLGAIGDKNQLSEITHPPTFLCQISSFSMVVPQNYPAL